MSKAEDLYNILKDDTDATIAWAEAEIREYQKLIELIKNKKEKQSIFNSKQ